MTSDRFPQLREMLSQPPSTEAFHAILKWLDKASKVENLEEFDLMFDYAQQHLDTWPDACRTARDRDIHPESPVFLLVRSFHLAAHDNDAFLPIADTVHATELTSLRITPREFESYFNTEGIRNLASAEYLDSLKELYINTSDSRSSSTWPGWGIPDLLASSFAPQLESLSLEDMDLKDDEGIAIAESPAMEGLVSLSLCNNEMDLGAATAIANSPYMTNLRRLDISFNGLENEGVQALANATTLQQLEHLDLRMNQVRSAGILALAGATGLPRLKSLCVHRDCDHIDEDELHELEQGPFIALFRSPAMSQLTRLVLYSSDLQMEGLLALVHSPQMAQLRELHIEDYGLKEEPALALAEATQVTKLHTLVLAYCKLGVEGAKILGQNPNVQHLKKLELERCRLEDEGAFVLADSPHFTQLEDLTIDDITIEGAKALINAFPRLQRLEIPRLYGPGTIDEEKVELNRLFAPRGVRIV